jgi:hypothetical protein
LTDRPSLLSNKESKISLKGETDRTEFERLSAPQINVVPDVDGVEN